MLVGVWVGGLVVAMGVRIGGSLVAVLGAEGSVVVLSGGLGGWW